MSKNSKKESFNYFARSTLYCIFDKLSNDDLLQIIKVYSKLDIQWPCLSFALEILEDRWVFYR